MIWLRSAFILLLVLRHCSLAGRVAQLLGVLLLGSILRGRVAGGELLVLACVLEELGAGVHHLRGFVVVVFLFVFAVVWTLELFAVDAGVELEV